MAQSSTAAGDIELDLGISSAAETGSLTLTGYGTTFSGTGQLSTGPCTVRWPSTTLTLDGTGLTIIGQQAPPSTTTPPAASPTDDLDGTWTGSLVGCGGIGPDSGAVPTGVVTISDWDKTTATFDWAFPNASGTGTFSGTLVRFSGAPVVLGIISPTVGVYTVSNNGTTLVMTRTGKCEYSSGGYTITFVLAPCSGGVASAAGSSSAPAGSDGATDGAASEVGSSSEAPSPPFGETDSPRRAGATFIPAVASAACLQVFIKIVGPIPSIGTRSGLSVDNYVPSDGPMNFTKLLPATEEPTPLVAIHQAGQQCLSGCANILITVLNKVTHLAAADTHVNVQLGAIDTASPTYEQGRQFLCVQTGDFQHQECGTSLDHLDVDNNGRVRLLYWAPGEVSTAHVELYAQACTPSVCALKRSEQVITVEPYRIYHYQGELSAETVAALVEMARSEGYFNIASHAVEQGLEASAEGWTELLGVESHAVKLALGPLGFGVAFALIELAHATSELLEEVGLRGAFFDASGLSEAGLYAVNDPSPFAKVLAPGDAVYFEDLVLLGGKVLTLPSGWLWELAEQLAKEYPYHTFHTLTDVKPEPLSLSVYEVSYCKQDAVCGPGYSALHSPDLRPDLCVYISQLDADLTCGIYYDAPIWVVSQEGLDKDLHKQPALDTSPPRAS